MSAPQKPSAISWLFQIVVALILLQTLFFKFTGAAESIAIFEQLGAEPWGRYASGLVELVASILILLPSAAVYGALLACCVMAGAMMSHLFLLGFSVNGDGGLLFMLALITLTSGLCVVWLRRKQLFK